MILYTLACEADHRFESWFSDMRAYDDLARTGALACPTCGSSRVGKAVMAPAVLGVRKGSAPADEASAPPPSIQGEPDATSAFASVDSRHRELRDLVRSFHAKVIAETQDVGRRFPEEARRIHESRAGDGDGPHRAIRGEATVEEAQNLLEDGIMILPMPMLPDEMN